MRKPNLNSRRWKYDGDVNLDYGGLFWREDGSDYYVCAVEVTPTSDAGGPSNLFYVEKGSIYLDEPGSQRRKSALNCIGATEETATRAQLVYAMRHYSGIDRDVYDGETVLQIGPAEPCTGRAEGWNPKPDRVLRRNVNLAKYVRREFLD